MSNKDTLSYLDKCLEKIECTSKAEYESIVKSKNLNFEEALVDKSFLRSSDMFDDSFTIPEPPRDVKYICINPTGSKILIQKRFSSSTFDRLNASTRMLSRILDINEALYLKCCDLRDVIESNNIPFDYNFTKLKYQKPYKGLLKDIDWDYRHLRAGVSPKNKYSRDYDRMYFNQINEANSKHIAEIYKLEEKIKQIKFNLEPHEAKLIESVEDPIGQLTAPLLRKIESEKKYLRKVHSKNDFLGFIKDAYLQRIKVFKIKYTYMLKMFKLESRLLTYAKRLQNANQINFSTQLFTVNTMEEKYIYCKFFLVNNENYKTLTYSKNDILYIEVKYKNYDKIEFKIEDKKDKKEFVNQIYKLVAKNRVDEGKVIHGLIDN